MMHQPIKIAPPPAFFTGMKATPETSYMLLKKEIPHVQISEPFFPTGNKPIKTDSISGGFSNV